MFENISYEEILDRMLDRIPDSLDKREGSIIYDALAPAAMELMTVYAELEGLFNESFADTATREYLIRRAAERGIKPKPATNAEVEIEIVPKDLYVMGERFNCGDINYIVTEDLGAGYYTAKCEEPGSIGNIEEGDLSPIEYIDELEEASIVNVLTYGQDEEDTEIFRKRYFDSLGSQAFGGNITDYKQKVKALNGIGGVKVIPIWNGGGTVKLIIISSDFKVCSSETVEKVQNIIDPKSQGYGYGLAPVGHRVTVVSCKDKEISITAKFTFASGWNMDNAKSRIEEVIDTYFKELARTWDETESTIVRISQLESKLLALEAIVDIEKTAFNGAEKNLVLAEDEIPKRGAINGVN